MATPEDSADVLGRLKRLHPKLIDLSLSRVEALLAHLGNPEHHLPPTVHVAGTNGKGSVIAYLRAALEAAGYSVHVHISPHLVLFNERIRLAGELIEEDDLIELLHECEDANGDEPITFFEITTAAALLAFARAPADIVLLETGLGGRLDATNTVKRPAMSVITPVSMDHQQFLGGTLAEIAAEKAGILKHGVVCVLARQAPEAAEVIRAKAEALGALLYEQDSDWTVGVDGAELVYEGPLASRRLPMPNLVGSHQIGNAGVAVAALDRLQGFTVDDRALAMGLTGAEWPGRMQKLRSGPLVDLLPADSVTSMQGGWELWLDGGHNPGASAIIAEQARAWAVDDGEKPLYLIVGMLNSKDVGEFFAPLARVARSVWAVAIPGEENSLSAEESAAAARAAGLKAEPATSVTEAIKAIAEESPSLGRVMICGSLYLAGWVLRENS